MAHAIEKLPKWAQEIIERQERRIAELRSNLDEVIGAIPPTPVWQVVNHGYGGSGPRVVRFLSDDEVIFSMPNPTKPDWPEIEIGIQRRTDAKGKVWLDVNSRRGVSVQPVSGNRLSLRAEDY